MATAVGGHARGFALSKPPSRRGLPTPGDFASIAQAKGSIAAMNTHQYAIVKCG